MLFGIGLVGFLSRRNMIVMFLSAEMMLQGVSVSLVAWGRFHNDFGGQALVVFIIAVAACEAAVALALIVTLFQRTASWTSPPGRNFARPISRASRSRAEPETESPPAWPHLAPAGVPPEVPREQLDRRPEM